MIRIPYMADLVNFLANDPNIIAEGLHNNIFLFAEWNIEKISKNWGDGIIIQPLAGDVISNTDRRTACRAQIDYQLMIAIQKTNPSSTVQHFVINQTGPLSITGAFSDAARLEEILRQSILDFNNSLQGTGPYSPLTLLELQEAEASNGFLVLKQIYKTSFTF